MARISEKIFLASEAIILKRTSLVTRQHKKARKNNSVKAKEY